jgi:AcrR family transcriptional regulator
MSYDPRSQRQRLLDSIMELSMHSSPSELSVAQIISHAGVSRATFYELFTEKEDALLAAVCTAVDRVFGGLQLRVDDRGWPQMVRSALDDLLGRVSSDPAAAWMACVQARGAGPAIRGELDRALDALEQRIEALLAHTPTNGGTLDIPATALTGAVRSILASSLRARREDLLLSLSEEILVWLSEYHVPSGRERWSMGPHARLTDIEPVSDAPPPGRLPRGRHGLPAPFVARTQRTRIIHATAQMMLAKGYAHATVADIVAQAAVARDVFYEHFASKQDAFEEAERHGTQQLLEACTDAYFNAAEWPERVWSVLELLLRAIAAAPALSQVQLLGCYEAGPEAVGRLEVTTRAFAIFLREGYTYRPAGQRPGPLASQAISGAILEIIQRRLARGQSALLPVLLPQLTYIALAPFTGPRDAAHRAAAMAAGNPPTAAPEP